MLNIGLMWMRATHRMAALARRAENRTRAGWDQYIFTEELNFNTAFYGVGCCHSPCLLGLLRSQGDAVQKTSKSAAVRRAAEGGDVCMRGHYTSAPPPAGSRFYRNTSWNPHAYNPPAKLNYRKMGRCTSVDNNVKCEARIGLNEARVCGHLTPRQSPSSIIGMPRTAPDPSRGALVLSFG